jgi:serine-type D-Ala-D-Ala endopeptidase (penicillin-binding protein 7)
MLKKTIAALFLSYAAAVQALPFSSQHALVFEEESGQVLLEKNANAVVPIASLTKLMTAMVVLDAHLDMTEMISIDESDVDTLKFSSSRVPVGTVMPRAAAMHLALMSSDNRAASALARTYPGGRPGFVTAVREKIAALGMNSTTIEEPTGLSPHNRSSASDLLKMATAASAYPEITRYTTETGEIFDMNGRAVQYHNTNRLVGRQGWDILMSKTGFTSEAGRCLIMRMQSAGKHLVVVLLNAKEGAARIMDAENIQRYVNGQPLLAARAAPVVRQASLKARAPQRGGIILAKAKVGGSHKASKKRRTV